MFMKIYLKTIGSLFLLTLPLISASDDLLKTNTSWDGGEVYYPEGEAEITSFKMNIENDVTTKFHCHPVPTMGHILTGTVEIETLEGKKTTLREGQSVVEVMRTVHRGIAVDGPVEIIVFHAGATDIPTTIIQGDPLAEKYCKQ